MSTSNLIFIQKFVKCNSFLVRLPHNIAIRNGSSSQEWLKRQHSDPYVDKAKMENYRCRSAFKLLEINEKISFLTPGKIVVDIGAAPGSWTQVAVKKVNADGADKDQPTGAVFSLDLLQIHPIQGASILSNMDFRTEAAQNKLKELLNGKKVDIVLSDMAPNASGVKSLDQDNIIGLCYRVFRFAAQVSKKNAVLLIKVWEGNEVPILEMDLGRFYKKVKSIKPPASRSDSAEKFIIARGFKGLQED